MCNWSSHHSKSSPISKFYQNPTIDWGWKPLIQWILNVYQYSRHWILQWNKSIYSSTQAAELKRTQTHIYVYVTKCIVTILTLDIDSFGNSYNKPDHLHNVHKFHNWKHQCLLYFTEGKRESLLQRKNKQPKEKVVWAFSSAIKTHATHKALELLMLFLFTTRDS